MIRRAAVLALSLTLHGVLAFAAGPTSDRLSGADADSNSGTKLAADVDWSLSPVQIGAPSRGVVLPALYVSFAALQIFDGYTTSSGLSRGAVEANGVMSGAAGNSATLWGVKASITAGSILVAERLWKNHHRAEAIATMVISNAVMGAVAAHNASTLRAIR